jgi:hypothetical protein
MILFLKILIAHLLGDFCFQPNSWVKDKELKKLKSLKLYYHILVHGALLALAINFNPQFMGVFGIVLLSHFLLDVIKIYLQNLVNKTILFFADQIAHITIIFCFTIELKIPLSTLFNFNNQIIYLILMVLLVTYVSAIVIKIMLAQWTPQTQTKDDESLIKAGRFIGILERLLVFIFIVNQHWEGVGFMLAAKSVFRFGDLKENKERKLTEYILIGTLLSFGFAIILGLLYINYTPIKI